MNAQMGRSSDTRATFRANAASCRARALNEPQNARYWVGEAQLWEGLAQDEVSSHFMECNGTSAKMPSAIATPSPFLSSGVSDASSSAGSSR